MPSAKENLTAWEAAMLTPAEQRHLLAAIPAIAINRTLAEWEECSLSLNMGADL